MARDYATLARRAASELPREVPREEKLRRLTALLWEALGAEGISWCGFYLPAPGGGELRLACCRPRPACSPIGLHGVCGKGFLTGKPQVVRDVAGLGSSYVACDPRDRSEVVVPLTDGTGCWGVLDLDSHEAGAFTEADAAGLAAVLRAAGL